MLRRLDLCKVSYMNRPEYNSVTSVIIVTGKQLNEWERILFSCLLSDLICPPHLNSYEICTMGSFHQGATCVLVILRFLVFFQILQMNVVHINRPRPLYIQYLPSHFTEFISHLLIFHIK
jgi:hypothetical protein